MKRIVLLLLVYVAVLNFGISQNIESLEVEKHAISDEQISTIHDVVNEFPEDTQLSFALIKGNEVSFYGTLNGKDTIIEVENHDSIFEIASISKVFTSTLLAQSIINDDVSLDGKVGESLGLEFNESIDFTFQQLSNHSSGLPRLPSNLFSTGDMDPFNPYASYSSDDMLAYLEDDVKLVNEQGKVSDYSNLGAGLLGHTLAKMKDKTYLELLEENIFSTYAMESSTIGKENAEGRLVKGLNNFGVEAKNWDWKSMHGAGAILSTTEDLSKFVLAHLHTDNEAFALTRKKTISLNDNVAVGLGMHIISTRSGSTWFWHNGGSGGYSSSMAFDMENKTGIVILSNVSAFNPQMGKIDQLCFKLMNSFKEKE